MSLMLAIETQLKLQGFSYDCHCPSCNTLKPLAYALAQAKEEASQEDYRVFCARAQEKSEAQDRAQAVAESGGALAQARLLGDGRIELSVDDTTIHIFTFFSLFVEYCQKHAMTVRFV